MQIVIRMLNNLREIYSQRDDSFRAETMEQAMGY